MQALTERTLAPLLARRAAWLLCGLWLLAGVVGHDPWKADDALHLGVAWSMAGGDWLVPRIAGDPWLVGPPLYHWLAALCGKLFGWLLPWHDAARLASALFGGLYLVVISRTAYRLDGGSAALAAPLLAVGTLGMLVPMHDAQPAIAAIAGFAIALRGLAIWQQQATRGASIFGLGLGISFLAAGSDIAAIELATAFTLMLHSGWRRREPQGLADRPGHRPGAGPALAAAALATGADTVRPVVLGRAFQPWAFAAAPASITWKCWPGRRGRCCRWHCGHSGWNGARRCRHRTS
jgi:4-amino-4-deoxy-L-arabinose transferase-like glycosyltransferase